MSVISTAFWTVLFVISALSPGKGLSLRDRIALLFPAALLAGAIVLAAWALIRDSAVLAIAACALGAVWYRRMLRELEK